MYSYWLCYQGTNLTSKASQLLAAVPKQRLFTTANYLAALGPQGHAYCWACDTLLTIPLIVLTILDATPPADPQDSRYQRLKQRAAAEVISNLLVQHPDARTSAPWSTMMAVLTAYTKANEHLLHANDGPVEIATSHEVELGVRRLYAVYIAQDQSAITAHLDDYIPALLVLSKQASTQKCLLSGPLSEVARVWLMTRPAEQAAQCLSTMLLDHTMDLKAEVNLDSALLAYTQF